jgi:hypothetical protein
MADNKIALQKYEDIDLNLKEAVCNGHVNLNQFSEECKKEFKAEPVKIAHEYRVFKKIVTKNERGKITNVHHTHVRCEGYSEGAEKVTVGYFYY